MSKHYKTIPLEDAVNKLLIAARYRKIFNKISEPSALKKDLKLEKDDDMEFTDGGELKRKVRRDSVVRENIFTVLDSRNLMSLKSVRKVIEKNVDESIEMIKTENCDHTSTSGKEVLKKFRSIVRTKILKKIDYNSTKDDFFSLLKRNMQSKEPLNALRSARNSFFVFGLDSKLRLMMVQIKKSSLMKILVRFFLVLNFISNCIHTNENRLHEHSEDSMKNRVAKILQLICYCFFGVEVTCALIAKGCVLEGKTYLRKPWNILNFIVTVSSLLSLSPLDSLQQITKTISIFRFFRILKSFKSLKKAMNSFFKTIFSVGNVLYNMVFLILFYSIVGLHFYKGLTENRCRNSPVPPANRAEIWTVAEGTNYYCGSNQCPTGTFCINPTDFDFPENPKEYDIKDLKYGLANYNNIFMAVITNMNFVTFTGWSGISDIIWNAFNPSFVVVYNVSLMLFAGLVLNNMLVAALYEGYISNQFFIKNFQKKLVEDEEIKKNKKEGFKNITEKKIHISQGSMSNGFTEDNININKASLDEIMENSDETIKKEEENKPKPRVSISILDPFGFTKKLLNNKPGSFRRKLGHFLDKNPYFNFFVFFLILTNIIVLCLDRSRLNQTEEEVYTYIDQIISIYFGVEMVIRIYAFGIKTYLKDSFEKVDCVIITVNLLEVIFQGITGESLTKGFSNSLQILRIFRFFAVQELWKSSAILFMEMMKVLYNIRTFFALILVFISITALVGEELFAYRVNDAQSPSHLISPRMNYDNFLLATRSTFMYYLNDEWHEIMYEHIKGTSKFAGFYFGIVLMTGQMFLMKIFAALFINELLASPVVKSLFRKATFWKKYMTFFQNSFKKAAIKLNGAIKKAMLQRKSIKQLKFIKKQKEELKIVNSLKSNGSMELHKSKKVSVGIKFEPEPVLSMPMRDSQSPKRSIDSSPSHKKIDTLSKILSAEKPSPNISLSVLPNPSLNLSPNPSLNFSLHPSANPSPAPPKETQYVETKKDFNLEGDEVEIKMQIKVKEKLPEREKSYLKSRTYSIRREPKGKSLNYFSSDNRFRVFVFNLVNKVIFERLILLTILISCLLLCLRNPLEDPDSLFNTVIFYFDVIVMIIYFAEISLKIIAYGFLKNGPKSFLQETYNAIDFLLLIMTILGTVDTVHSLVDGFNLRVFRVFRLIKIVKLTEGLKMAAETLVKSIPQMFQIFVFFFISYLVFAVIAVKNLKDKMYQCLNIDANVLANFVKTRSDCFDYGGDWLRKDWHYDHILAACSTLFQISTTEAWTYIMYDAWDAAGVNHQPITSFNPNWSFYHISFFMIANQILLNMLVGILVERYVIEKDEKSPYKGYTSEQKEWAEIKRSILLTLPRKRKPIPKNWFRKHCHNISKIRFVSKFFITVSLLNVFLFMLYWHRQDPTMVEVLENLNILFLSFSIAEIALKLVAKGFNQFFSHKRNIFHSLIIILSIAFVSINNISNDRILSAIGYGIQVMRVFRAIRKIKQLNKLITTLIHVLPQIYNIFMLMVLVFVVYSLIGMEFFAFIKPQAAMGTTNIHFRKFGIAMMTLLRATTGEGWHFYIHECSRRTQPNFVCKDINSFKQYSIHGLEGCGSYWAYPYWFSFIILMTLMIQNLFVAMLLSASQEVTKTEESAINRYQLFDIQKLWKEFDPEGTGFITYKEFWTFTSKIALIFGITQSELLDIKNKRNFLKALELPVYENLENSLYCYKFHDVVITLSKLSVILKYGIVDLEPLIVQGTYSQKSLTKINEKKLYMAHPHKSTNINSGQLAEIMVIRNKLRNWRLKKNREDGGYSDLSAIHFLYKKKKGSIDQEPLDISQSKEPVKSKFFKNTSFASNSDV